MDANSTTQDSNNWLQFATKRLIAALAIRDFIPASTAQLLINTFRLLGV